MMPDHQPAASQTADGAALLRAMHQLVDDPPPILDDPVSVRLVGAERADAIRSHPERAAEPATAGLRSHIVLRSRYAEDWLRDAAGRGVSQYVELGAGLDTFAYRQPSWADQLRIFEVDHQASQQMKIDRLAAAAIEVPANVTFVPIDLDAQPIGPALGRAGFDASKPAFVSCLGVLAYLRPETADSVFGWVASLIPGSEFVFTFARPVTGPQRGTAARAAELHEPWLTRLEPDELNRRLIGLGFRAVEFPGPLELASYYSGRKDALRPPGRAAIARAIV
jgi:methyltransferase (TIGR00027 family)